MKCKCTKIGCYLEASSFTGANLHSPPICVLNGSDKIKHIVLAENLKLMPAVVNFKSRILNPPSILNFSIDDFSTGNFSTGIRLTDSAWEITLEVPERSGCDSVNLYSSSSSSEISEVIEVKVEACWPYEGQYTEKTTLVINIDGKVNIHRKPNLKNFLKLIFSAFRVK